MNKIKKVWLRINHNRTLNKDFIAEYYRELICEWKERFGFIDFHSSGPGIILRHDIDSDLDKAVYMAEIEAGHGVSFNQVMFEHGYKSIVKSTYFVLNTAKYWKSKEMIPAIQCIQSLGHEIGWHNNAIVEHIKTGKPIINCISEPLQYLRENGIIIRGSAAHGDKLCKELGFINYNIFKFKSPGWDYWVKGGFEMSDFGLEYEAYHVPYDYFLADCHTGWNGKYDDSGWQGKRVQVLIHPQNWRL
jgi:hypothetical protein